MYEAKGVESQEELMQDVHRCGVNLDCWWPGAHECTFRQRGCLGYGLGLWSCWCFAQLRVTTYFRLGILRILRLLHPVLDQGIFRSIFGQDRRAVEEEQRAYSLHHQDLSRESNPVSHAVRQMIRKQIVGCPSLPERILG